MAGYTVNIYSGDDQIDKIARNQNYGIDTPFIFFALSFQNSGSNYKYNFRFNLSNRATSQVPSPTLDLTTKSKLNLGLYSSSLYRGLIGITNMINNKILELETTAAHVLVNKMGPIYQEAYVNDQIYGYLVNSMQFLVLLPLLIVYQDVLFF